ASLLYSLALLALGERLSDASSMLGRAQALFDELGDVHGLALTWSGLAVVDRLSGRYAEALVRDRDALAGFEQVGDLVGESHVRRDMAQIHMDQQRYDVAERLLREALAVCRTLGAHRVTAQTEYQLAELHLRTGRLEEAERSFEAARQSAGEVRDIVGQAYAMLGLGITRSARGEPDRAERDLRAALDIADQTDNLLIRGRTRLALAELDAARDRVAAGMARLEQALSLLSEYGPTSVWRARALDLKARFHVRAGAYADARRDLHAAVALAHGTDAVLAGRLTDALAKLPEPS